MDPNWLSNLISTLQTIFSPKKGVQPRRKSSSALSLFSFMPKDKSIDKLKWPKIENSYYQETSKALHQTYQYLLLEEKRWLRLYWAVLISGFLIIIFAIIMMFLENVFTGILLIGIGTATSITSSVFLIQVNSIIKQKTKLCENINNLDKIHLSINEALDRPFIYK